MHVRLKEAWELLQVAGAQRSAKAMSEKFGVAYVVSQGFFNPNAARKLHVYVASFEHPPMFDLATVVYTYVNGKLSGQGGMSLARG